MNRSTSYLKALKTFEAAARHQSFTLAADELCITQAAVSHQIKGLEEKLGFPVFHRHIRRVSLTVPGENLFRTLIHAFATIEDSISSLRAHVAENASLNISLTPSFSSKWLLPRLVSFTTEYPNIELHLYHSISNRDLIKTDIDVAIRWGDGNWPGFISERLTESRLIPVCAPDYLRPEHPLKTTKDFDHYTFLHEDTHADWSRWLEKAGETGIISNRGLIIDDSNALTLAALNGQGIALGRTPLIDMDVRSGRLICPFNLSILCDDAYYITYLPTKADRPAVRSFIHFIKKQIQESQSLPAVADVKANKRLLSSTL